MENVPARAIIQRKNTARRAGNHREEEESEMNSNSNHAKKILESTIAGSWYPGSAEELNRDIQKAMREVPENKRENGTRSPNILILPHAGYAYSLRTSAYALHCLPASGFERAVVLAPSHRAWLEDQIAAPEADSLTTPYGSLPVDRDALERFDRLFPMRKSDVIHGAEHAAQIQYPLIQFLKKECPVLPLIVGSLSSKTRRKAADALRGILDAKTLLIVSSDFTHYGSDFGFEPFRGDVRKQVEALDLEVFRLIQGKDPDAFESFLDRSGATVCGRYPLALMLETLPQNASFQMLHYETSSDRSGDFRRFVCYLSAAGYADFGSAGMMNKSETGKEKKDENRADDDFLSGEEKKQLLILARNSIRCGLETGKRLKPPVDGAEKKGEAVVRKPAGCFVTLTRKEDRSLRGCIGEIEAYRSLDQAVSARAYDAVFRDPRFAPLEPEEFESIEIEISVLTPSHPVNSWRDIIPGKHGMTIRKDGRSAVFLPQVAPEQGWDLETTLTHLSLKAGLSAEDWKSGAEFTVFEAIVFREDDFV